MPGVVDTTHTFTTNEVITSTLMNNIIDQTLFTSDALSGGTLALVSGKMKVATSGITSNEIASNAVTTSAIASSSSASTGVTYAKMQYVDNMKALGNVSGSLGVVSEVSILDEDNMASDSATALATQQSIKAYTDTKVAALFVRGTAVATTSGTSVDFTGIPSTVKRITVMFNAVSNSGGDEYIIQIGDAGGIETTAYVSQSSDRGGDVTATNGFIISRGNSSSSVNYGTIIINNFSGNIWASFGNLSRGSTVASSTGSKTLSATLDRIRITTAGGVNTFDEGQVNIMYE
jgi:hypothetical protein